MKQIVGIFLLLSIGLVGFGQSYTTTLDTFYVPSPEFSQTLGLDSLHFPCAVTQPDTGNSFPILILVHGSSALDKDANSTKDFKDFVGAPYRKANTRMFYEIADSLSSNGIMVLRYDKRSFTVNCIEKPACWWADTITPYDYIKDVNYAVEYAKTLPAVDTCNIFIAGHSQGGSFAPDAGFKRNDVRGVICLAPTAQPVDTLVVFQTRTVDNDPVGANRVRAQFDSLRAGLWPMTDTLYNQVFSPRFWLDWIHITDSTVWLQQQSTVPTLFMYGSIDKLVPPATHMQIWMDSISRANATFQMFNLLDHSFGTEFDSTMSPAVLDSMTAWIHRTAIDCGPMGRDQNDDLTSVRVFPNPTNGQVYLENLDAEVTLSLRNVMGQSLHTYATPEPSIDLSPYPPGIYFLRIHQGATTYTVKLLKE